MSAIDPTVRSGQVLAADPATMSVPELRADLAARRERLSSTLGALAYQTKPSVIASSRLEAAKAKFVAATTDDDGAVRVDRVLALALAATAIVGLGVARHRRRRCGRRRRG